MVLHMQIVHILHKSAILLWKAHWTAEIESKMKKKYISVMWKTGFLRKKYLGKYILLFLKIFLKKCDEIKGQMYKHPHKKNLSVTKLWSRGAILFFWLSSVPTEERHVQGRGGSIMPRGSNMPMGRNMPGGTHQNQGSSMPRGSSMPKARSMPRASSMPWGGACREGNMPRGQHAQGSSMLREAVC